MNILATKRPDHEDELANIIGQANFDVRIVKALSGDRTLNAREQNIVERIKKERGEGIFSDMLYALTHKVFAAKQARILWEEIINHRGVLQSKLGRDVGLAVATHDYLSNITNMLSDASVIEESKMLSLTSVATRDGLTGLYDQATFRHRLKEELERQVRYGSAISLVMFDLDFFKKVNDTLGHSEGDRVLKIMADIIRNQVRKIDTAARYGGEEFAVILPEVENDAAYIFAERLRQNVENHFSGGVIPITISVGIATATADSNDDSEGLINRADKALYAAKHGGRNQVCKAQ